MTNLYDASGHPCVAINGLKSPRDFGQCFDHWNSAVSPSPLIAKAISSPTGSEFPDPLLLSQTLKHSMAEPDECCSRALSTSTASNLSSLTLSAATDIEMTEFSGAQAMMTSLKNEIAFIDPSIDELDVFLAGMRPEVEGIVLSSQEDALLQISKALCDRSQMHDLHIVTHGCSGELSFSAGAWTLESLDQLADGLRALGMALASNAQVTLWSCELAQGSRGQQFINQLSDYLGKNVSASSQRVGSESLGAGWQLDVTMSDVINCPLSAEAQGAYRGVMATDWPIVQADSTGINLSNTTNITGIAANNGLIYVRDGGASVDVYDFDGQFQHSISLDRAYPTSNNQMTFAGKSLYMRDGAELYQVNPVNGDSVRVTDGTDPLNLAFGDGWISASLFSLPDGHIGIVGARYNDQGATVTDVTIFTLSNGGSEVDPNASTTVTLATGNYPQDMHGAASDGNTLILINNNGSSGDGYRIFDLNTGEEISDAPSWDLVDPALGTVNIGNSVWVDYDATEDRYVVGDWKTGNVLISGDGNAAPVVNGSAETGQLWAVESNGWPAMDHAVWFFEDINDEPGREWHTAIRVIEITEAGDYTFTGNVDNYGRIFLDGEPLHQGDFFTGSGSGGGEFSNTRQLDSGFYTLEIQGQNAEAGGAAGFSLNITDSNDQSIWTTRTTLDPDEGLETYTENDLPTAIVPGLMVEDVDSGQLLKATVSIGENYQPSEDVLSFTAPSGISGSWDSDQGILTLTGPASVAGFQAALRSVTYFNSSDDPDTQDREISFQVDDNATANNLSQVFTHTIEIQAVNDAPVIGDLQSDQPFYETVVPISQTRDAEDNGDESSNRDDGLVVGTFTVSDIDSMVNVSLSTSDDRFYTRPVSNEEEPTENDGNVFELVARNDSNFDFEVEPTISVTVTAFEFDYDYEEFDYDHEDNGSQLVITPEIVVHQEPSNGGSEENVYPKRGVEHTKTFTLSLTDVEPEEIDVPGSQNDLSIVTGDGDADITTGDGDDHVTTGDGDDFVFTNGGNDVVNTGDGDDIIEGGSGAGDDVYDAGTHTLGDTVIYPSATNSIYVDLRESDRSSQAVLGADTIPNGGAPDNIGELLAAAGYPSTTLVGSAQGSEIGTDALINIENVTGGSGDDYFIPSDATSNEIDGGAGIDEVDYTYATGSITANLNGVPGSDVLTNIENVTGSAQDDFITGNASNNEIHGGDGNDTLKGAGGDDSFFGGSGADEIDGGSGTGSGSTTENDTVYYDGTYENRNALQVGDELKLEDGTTGSNGGQSFPYIDTLINIETVVFTGSDGIGGADADVAFTIINGNALILTGDDDASGDEGSTIQSTDVGNSSVLDNDIELEAADIPNVEVVDVEHTDTTSALPTSNAATGNVGVAISGTYGDLTLNDDGTFSYTADNDAMQEGVSYTDTFTYTVTDGQNPVKAILEFTVTGKNDEPEITVATNFANISEEAGDVNNQDIPVVPAQLQGTITVKDLDAGIAPAVGDQLEFSVTGNAQIQYTKAGETAPEAALPTEDSVIPAEVTALTAVTAIGFDTDTTPLTADGTAQTSNWSYDPTGTFDLNWLREGDQLTITYTAQVTDDGGTTQYGNQPLVITIVGTNDVPEISGIDPAPLTLNETTGVDTPIDFAAVGGTLDITDQDLGDSLTLSVVGDASITHTAAPSGSTSTAVPAAHTSDVSALIAANAIDFQTQLASNGEIVEDVSWSYDPEQANLDWLAVGEVLTITYQVQVFDGTTYSAPQNLEITVTGTNDAPLFAAADAAETVYDVAESTGDRPVVDSSLMMLTASGQTASGNLAFSDADDSDTFTASVSGPVVSDQALPAFYGSHVNDDLLDFLSLNGNGSTSVSVSPNQGIDWTFEAPENYFDYLGDGLTTTLQYTVSVDDGQGGTDTQTITITVQGSNDAPFILTSNGPQVHPDVYDAEETSSEDPFADASPNLSSSGLLAFYDLDEGDTHQSFVSSVTLLGVLDPAISNPLDVHIESSGDYYDLFAVDPARDIADGRFDPDYPYEYPRKAIDWTFDSPESMFDYLADGESVQLSYEVYVGDSSGTANRFDSETVAITVYGSNDGPVISLVSDGDGADKNAESIDETNAALTADGTLTVTDVDVSDTVDVSVGGITVAAKHSDTTDMTPAELSALLGSVGLTESTLNTMLSVAYASGDLAANGKLNADGNTHNVEWSFNSNGQAFDFLATGEKLVLTYDISAQDDSGVSSSDTSDTSDTVTITIVGTNDKPLITLPAPGSASAIKVETDGTLSANDVLTVIDPDFSDQVTVRLTQAVATDGEISGAPANLTSMFSFSSSSMDHEVLLDANTGSIGNLSWFFDSATFDASASSHFDYLGRNEYVEISATIRYTDDPSQLEHLWSKQVVTITITGTNDQPEISLTGTDSDSLTLYDVEETLVTLPTSPDNTGGDQRDPDVTFGANDHSPAASNVAVVSGTLSVKDLDVTDTVTSSISQVQVIGQTSIDDSGVNDTVLAIETGDDLYYLYQLLNVTGTDANDPVLDDAETNGSITWTFTGEESGFDYLDDGQTLTLRYSVVVEDDSQASGAPDEPAASTTQIVEITIIGTNDAPDVVADTFAITENVELEYNVINPFDGDADSDPEGHAFSVVSVNVDGTVIDVVPNLQDEPTRFESELGAEVAIEANGEISYHADESFDGLKQGETVEDEFTYTVEDENGAQSTTTVKFVVTGVNDPINAGDDAIIVVNSADLIGNVTDNDSDADSGDTMRVVAIDYDLDDAQFGDLDSWNTSSAGFVLSFDNGLEVNLARDGSYTINTDGIAAATTVTSSFLYNVRDGAGSNDWAKVTITAGGANNDASISGDTSGDVSEDGVLTVSGQLVIDDVDVDQDELASIAAADLNGSYGSFTIQPDGAWVYALNNSAANVQALNENEEVQDSVTVQSADGTDSATITVTITGSNDGPVLSAGTIAQIMEGAAADTAVVTMSAADDDAAGAVGESATFSLGFGNNDGLFKIDPQSGVISLAREPDDAEVGPHTLQVLVEDSTGATDSLNIEIPVENVNDAPVAVVDVASTVEDNPISVPVANLLANDSDADGDSLSITNVSVSAAEGTAAIVSGDVVFTPAANFNGVATISYTLSDATLTTTGALLVTVNPVNDAPSNITVNGSAIVENSAGAVVGPVTVTDPDNDTVFSYTVNDQSFEIVNGELKLKDGISLDADQTGSSIVVTITATDSGGESLSKDFTIAVTDVNEAPEFSQDPLQLSTQEDTAMTGSVAFATDPDQDTLTYSAPVTSDNGGTVSVGSNGSLSYTPAADFSGADSFVVTVDDGNGNTDTLTVLMTVDPVNDYPEVTGPVDATGNEDDTSFIVDLLSGATDPDGDTMTVTMDTGVTLPDYATQSGAFVTIDLTDTAIQSMSDGDQISFNLSYVIDDGHHASVPQTATITVTGTNDAPTVDAALTSSASEDDSVYTVDLLAGANDIEGDTLSVDFTGAEPAGLSLLGNILSIDPSDAAFQSIPAGIQQDVVFNYDIVDGNGGSVSQSLTITLTGTNDLPTVGTSLTAGGNEDDANFTLNLLSGASDIDNDTLTVTPDAPLPAGLTLIGPILTVSPSAAAFQALAAGESDVLTINYTISDGNGGTVPQTATITIDGVNDAVALAGAITETLTENDGLVSVDLLTGASDADSGSSMQVDDVQLSSGAAGGISLSGNTLEVDTDQYQSLKQGQSETATFTYDVVDDQGARTTQTATIIIEGRNDAPIVDQGVADTSAAQDTYFEYDVMADAFKDVDVSDTLTLTATLADGSSLPAWLSFDGVQFSGTPSASDVATISVKVTATDEGLLQAATLFTISMAGVNGAPSITPIANQTTPEDAPLTVNVLANAVDPDTDPMMVSDVTASVGLASVDANDQIIFTPPADFNGIANIGFTVSDGINPPVFSFFLIEVTAVNDAPTFALSSAGYSVAEDGSLSDSLPVVTDVDGDALSYRVGTDSGEQGTGLLTVDNAGNLIYIPAPNFNGADEFVVYVSDGTVETPITVTMNVAAIADAPTLGTAINDAQVDENAALNLVIPSDAFEDADGDTLTLTATLANGDPLPSWMTFDPVAGTFSGTPGNNDAGVYDIQVTATDPSSLSATASFSVTVVDTNSAPVVNDDTASTGASGSVSGDVLANDSDPDAGDVLTVSNPGVMAGQFGTLVLAANGGFTYLMTDESLAAGDTASETFTIRVTDGMTTPLTSTLSISITGSNDAPVIRSELSDLSVVQASGSLSGQIVFIDPDAGDTHTAETEAGIGDFNGDGMVSFADAMLLWPHLNQGYDGQYDLNNDGFVNNDDAVVFESVFGKPAGATVTYSENGTATTIPAEADVNELKLALTLNSDGTWTYDTGIMDLSYLDTGEQLDIVYDVVIEDAAGEVDSAQLTVSLTGDGVGGLTLSATVDTETDTAAVDGTSGNDVLQGSADSEVFTGGLGEDIFIYQALDGADTITDFTPGEDQLAIQNLGLSDAQAALDLAQTVNGDAVIDFGNGDSITLEGIDVANLTTDDFLIQ